MEKAWNKELQFFGQSYEQTDVLDSALLIMPLVFFSTPVRVPARAERWMMLRSRSKTVGPAVLEHAQAHLAHARARRPDVQRELPRTPRYHGPRAHVVGTVQGLVYRYDVEKTEDGVGGEEGTFCLCTLW